MFKNIRPIPSLLMWQRMLFAAILGLLFTRYEWSLLLSFCLLLYACTRNNSSESSDNRTTETKDRLIKDKLVQNELITNAIVKDKLTKGELSKNKLIKDKITHYMHSKNMGIALLLITSFVIALLYGNITNPQKAFEPDWVEPLEYVEITGEIVRVQGMQDMRLRLYLKDVHTTSAPISMENLNNVNTTSLPDNSENINASSNNKSSSDNNSISDSNTKESTSPTQEQTLPGIVTLTWQSPPLSQGYFGDLGRPIVGQHITVRTKVRPIYGFTQEYWAGKNIWYTTWANGTKNIVPIKGSGASWARAREHIRYSLTSFLNLEDVEDYGMTYGRSYAEDHHVSSNEYQARAMIPGLLFGDKFYLKSLTYDRFSRSGLVHSLALSGQHLGICTFFAGILAYILGILRPNSYLKTPHRKVILYIAIPLTLIYVWLGDAPLSLIRAACMLFIGGILFLRSKTHTLLDIIFTAALLFILVSPQSIFEIGVQLSFLCVFGIALFMPILTLPHRYFVPNPEKAKLKNTFLSWALSVLLTSFIIQVATLPLTIHYFGYTTLLFPLNIIWLPILYFITLPLSFLGLLFLPISAQICDFIFFIALLPAEFILFVLENLADRNLLKVIQVLKPLPLSFVGYALALILFCMTLGRTYVWKKFPLLLLAVVLLVPISAIVRHYQKFSFEGIEITVFDVGQGQGILLETTEGRTLIDAGGSLSPRFDPGQDIIAHELTKNKRPRLQYFIASHDDTDHTRGFIWLAETFQVDAFIQSTHSRSDTLSYKMLHTMLEQEQIPIIEIATGDSIDLGDGFYLEVLFPDILPEDTKSPYSSNDSSLLLRLTKGDKGLALFCGDIGTDSIEIILERLALEKSTNLPERLAAERLYMENLLPEKLATQMHYTENPEPEKPLELTADILILPHHGSKNSLSIDFYKAVDPMLAIVSSGRFNWFRQPHKSIENSLDSLNIPIINTANMGHIKVRWKDGQWKDLQKIVQ